MVSKNLFTTVVGLQDRPIASIVPGIGQALVWNGNAWVPDDTGTITSVNAGLGLTGGGASGDVTLGLMGPLPIQFGGTGQGTAAAALAALGGAPISNPVFLGVPQGPTANPGDDSNQLATTAYVQSAILGEGGDFLPITGGTVTGGLQVNGAFVANAAGGAISLPNGGISGAGNISMGGTANFGGSITGANLFLGDAPGNGAITVSSGPSMAIGTGTTGNLITLSVFANETNFNGNIEAGNLSAGGSSYDGTANVAATVQSNNGRIVSVNANNQPSFSMWDTGLGVAGGLYSEVGTGRLGFAQMDGGGNPTAGLAWVDRSGNFSANGQISTPSNVIGDNSVQSNGVYFQNNQGWFYTPQNFCAGGVLAPANSFGNGVYWSNNGGWMYCPEGVWCNNVNTGPIQMNGQELDCGTINCGPLNSNSNVSAAAAIFFGGMYWQNNGGYAYCPWAIHSGGNVYLDGIGVLYAGNGGANFMGLRWPSGQGVISFDVDGGWVGNVTPNGSDPRLKTNFKPVETDALDVIMQIEMQQFDLQMPGPNVPLTHWDVGFMSDQLRTLIPLSVIPGDGVDSFDTIRELALIGYAFRAIQQLNAKIEALGG